MKYYKVYNLSKFINCSKIDKKKVYICTPSFIKPVRVEGVEPPRLAALDPKSSVSTNSTTSAEGVQI